MQSADTLGAAMRAWVVGLLLAVMSFQSAWAGIAVYCRHQADVVADHIGHHEHRHAGVADLDADDPPAREAKTFGTGLGGVDDDCGFCHLSCAQPLATVVESWIDNPVHEFVRAAPMRYSSREPGVIERPNWPGLARSASLEELRIT